MKTLLSVPRLAPCVAFCLLFGAANAQVVPTPTPAASAATDDKAASALVLSPFEVVTEKDKGFMAVNAGSATKLGLDMNDMPAAYSVMTRELIDNLGITNLEQTSLWVVGGALAPGDGTPNDSTSTPNTVFTNTRGQMNTMGQQRNFFANNGIGDTYNMDRIDFGRGPNAVLFNYGDQSNPFAGGVSAQTKQASLGRNMTRVALRAGSWDFNRAMVDLNRPFGERLAGRLNLLWQRADGYRLGEQDNRRGIASALVFRPTQTTEIQVGGNYDYIERTNAYAAIFDNLSGWDGRTVLTGPITNAVLGAGRDAATRAPLAGTTFNNGQFLSSSGDVQGVARLSTTPQNVYVPGQGIMNWQNFATTVRADSNEYVPIYNGSQTFSRYDLWRASVDNGGLVASTIAPTNLLGLGTAAVGGGYSLLYQNNSSPNMYARALNGSQFRMPDKRFSLMPRNEPLTVEYNRGINMRASHRMSQNLWLYVNADWNDTRNRIFNQGTANSMRFANIDINRNLPDGTPNPHFLEPYSLDPSIAFRRYSVKNSGIRPGVNYSFNLGKWGRYVFNGGLGLTTREQQDRQYALSLAQSADPRIWTGPSNLVRVREYWSDPIMPFDLTSSVPYFSNTFDTANNVVGAVRSTVQPRYVLNNAGGIGFNYREQNLSLTMALSGRYFYSEKLGRERLVLVAGGTMNRVNTSRRDAVNFGNLPTNWDGISFVSRPDAPADWAKMTYLLKNADGSVSSPVPRLAINRPRAAAVEGVSAPLAQYANDRFRDDYNLPERKASTRNVTLGYSYDITRWLNMRVNYSNSFNPPSVGALDLFTDPALPFTAFGWDARFSLRPFGDTFTANIGWFYNQSAHTRVNSPVAASVNNLYGTRDYTDTNTNNRNSGNFQDLTGQDYQSVNSLGAEVEVVGRITRGLQISSGYSRFRGHAFDRFPQTRSYVATEAPDFLEALRRAGGSLDTTNKPPGAPNAPGLAIPNPAIGALTGTQLTNQNTAINNFNAIYVALDNPTNAVNGAYAANPVTNQLYPWGGTFNMVARYEIQGGRMRGFRFSVGRTWTERVSFNWNLSTNVVPNPNYDKNRAFNTSTGVIGADGRYTFRDALGNATGYNAPWMPDPSINQLNPPRLSKGNPQNTVLTLGYRRKFAQGAGWLSNRTLDVNMIVNNVFNKQLVFNSHTPTLRAPGGDYLNNQYTRVNTLGGMANNGYQVPINGSIEVSVTF